MNVTTPVIGKRYKLMFNSGIPDYAKRAGQIGTVTGYREKSAPLMNNWDMWDVQTDDGWTGIVYKDELAEIMTVIK